MKNNSIAWSLLRIVLGFIMLWAFLDKLFGLGFATSPAKSWLNGGSPTAGFLKMGTQGPFASLFQSLSGSPIVDWLFMMGLLLIGTALILGIGMKIAGYSGALLMFFMWLATLFPKNNPLVDEHIIYLLIFLGFARSQVGHTLSLHKWWISTKLVKKNPILS